MKGAIVIDQVRSIISWVVWNESTSRSFAEIVCTTRSRSIVINNYSVQLFWLLWYCCCDCFSSESVGIIILFHCYDVVPVPLYFRQSCILDYSFARSTDRCVEIMVASSTVLRAAALGYRRALALQVVSATTFYGFLFRQSYFFGIIHFRWACIVPGTAVGRSRR